LHLSNRPALFLANEGTPGEEWMSVFFTLREWQQLQSGLNLNAFLIQNVVSSISTFSLEDWDAVYPGSGPGFAGDATNKEYWDLLRSFNAANASKLLCATVNPGYDDRGIGARGLKEPKVLSRQQGARYSASWEACLSHQADLAIIETWNCFGEGSAVEPVKEIILHKSTAVPGWGYRELISTREYAIQFTGKTLWPLASIFLPERLYRLRKSGSPRLRGDRLRIYLMEGDVTGAMVGLEQAGV
jgi:hypothetical protein